MCSVHKEIIKTGKNDSHSEVEADGETYVDWYLNL